MKGQDSEFRAAVKARHGFETWRGRVGADASDRAYRRLFLFDSTRLPKLVFQAREPLHPEGGAHRGYRDYFAVKGAKDAGVMVVIHETPSIADAHEALADFLETCMAPALVPLEERGLVLGHVGFTGHGREVDGVRFVRGSTLVQVENTGGKLVDVTDVAREVDRQLAAHIAQDTAREH